MDITVLCKEANERARAIVGQNKTKAGAKAYRHEIANTYD